MKTLIRFSFFTIFLFIGCTATKPPVIVNPRPSWIESTTSKYPEGRYLSAIGDGISLKSAEDNARGNLAKIFAATVRTEDILQERSQELRSALPVNFDANFESSNSSVIASDQTVYNIEIGDFFTESNGHVYAVAFIDRSKTSDIYNEKISDNAKFISKYVLLAKSSQTPMEQYAAWNAADVFSEENRRLISQLSVINHDAFTALKLDYSHQEILKKLTESAQKISFTVEISNDTSKIISNAFAHLISEMGFSLNAPNSIAITGSVLYEVVQLENPLKFIRYSLFSRATDMNGSTVVSFVDNGREGHINYDEALARCNRTMAKRIDTEFRRKLYSYFDRMARKKL